MKWQVYLGYVSVVFFESESLIPSVLSLDCEVISKPPGIVLDLKCNRVSGVRLRLWSDN